MNKFVCAAAIVVACTNTVRAESGVSTSISADYYVSDTGQISVRQHINLKNDTSKEYATAYQVRLSGVDLSKVTVSDERGPLPVTFYPAGDGGGLVSVRFPEEVVGLGSVRSFTIAYEAGKAERKEGVWEVVIAEPAYIREVEEFELRLHVRPGFGEAIRMEPEPEYTLRDGEGRVYVFSKGGVFANFGHFSVWDFKLTYQVDNVKNSIYLPPDTGDQRVVYASIEPFPEVLERDALGNLAAKFGKLKEAQKVVATGRVYFDKDGGGILYSVTDTEVKPEIELIRGEFQGEAESSLSVSFAVPWLFLPNLSRLKMRVVNNSGEFVYRTELVSEAKLSTTQIDVLEPFGTKEVQVLVPMGKKYLTVKVGNDVITYNVPERLFFVWYLVVLVFFSILIIAMAVVASRARSLYLQRRFGTDPVYRQG